ncbi:MAG: M48 family metallopeptidase, partial [Clostridia bacterium]|nr:M48 family metallopeptidase [Clostridia bacterium]
YADRYAERMGTAYKKLSVTGARTRWGSCSFDDSLHFSFRLLYAPKEMIEYVVVHELAHTKHKNHSPLFWAEVGKYIPDYKKRRKWLKTHALLMQIF